MREDFVAVRAEATPDAVRCGERVRDMMRGPLIDAMRRALRRGAAA